MFMERFKAWDSGFIPIRKPMNWTLQVTCETRPDGSVYIEAAGEAEMLEMFINWCEDGPIWAHVSKLEKQEIPLFDADDFRIK